MQITPLTSTTALISWLPSQPALPERRIDRYEVVRNGAKVGQTSETQFGISFDPASSVLEFYSVRAVDNRKVVSVASDEVLLSKGPGPTGGDVSIEMKAVVAERIKEGIRGLLSDRRYQRGTYVYNRDQVVRNYDLSSLSTREDRRFAASYDPETARWSLDSVAGGYFRELRLLDGGASPAPVVGTWTAGSGNPPAAELRAPDGALLSRWPLHGYAFQVPGAEADTSAQFLNPDDGSITTVELSDELSEQEFRAGIERDFMMGLDQASSLPWDSLVSVSHGESTVSSQLGSFSDLAARIEYEEGDTITLKGCVYRLRFTGVGVKTFRWLEVTTFDDDSEPISIARQETIDFDHTDGGSRAFTVMPPASPGTTEIQLLTAGIAVHAPTPASASAASFRLYSASGLTAGGAAEIVVSVASGWLDGNGSAVLSVAGADGVVRFVAIDPMLEASDGLEAAIAMGEEIAAGSDLLLDPAAPGFPDLGGKKLVAVGVRPGQVVVQVALTSADDPLPTILGTPLVVYPHLALAVDLNRDGTIRLAGDDSTDEVSAEKPFRFWINDDADAGDASGITDYSDGASPSANFKDQVVNGNRDLVDFFAVYLDLKQMLAVLPPSESVKYRLRHAEGALNFVYTNRTRANAVEYQTKLLPDGFGDRFDQSPGAAATHLVPVDGVALSADFLAQAASGDGGVILVEGRRATSAPLVLAVEQSGTVLAEARLELRVSPVESMFRHVDLTRAATAYDGRALALPNYVPPTRTADPGDAWPDRETNGKYFVFIHGFNTDGQKARGWHAEVFKRLHILGSRARFVGVTWHGATGARILGEYTDYHQAVFNAFQTGDALAGALAFTQGADVTVAAHSLGNIVASQAIQSGGLAPARYFMVNAAVPLEAYDFESVPSEQSTAMTESKWGNDLAKATFAANWHGWFAGRPEDSRNALKWKDRFKNATERAYNFYSPGDEVVEDPEWNSPSMLKLVLAQGFNFSRGAWVTQEFAKGATFLESAAVAFLSRVQGGWGQSVDYWPVGPSLRSPDQTREPYFGYFLEHQLFDADPTKASAKAANLLVRHDLLARGIPAMSFAAATHRMVALGGNAGNASDRNIDMEAVGRQSGVWPIEGHTLDRKALGRWLHSDFKNVALPYVSPMYEIMLNRGALR